MPHFRRGSRFDSDCGLSCSRGRRIKTAWSQEELIGVLPHCMSLAGVSQSRCRRGALRHINQRRSFHVFKGEFRRARHSSHVMLLGLLQCHCCTWQHHRLDGWRGCCLKSTVPPCKAHVKSVALRTVRCLLAPYCCRALRAQDDHVFKKCLTPHVCSEWQYHNNVHTMPGTVRVANERLDVE